MKEWGRYLDVDDDGVCYRTIPGTHPSKGSFFTRGTSRDEYAKYTEDGAAYVRVVNRIAKKWETAKSYVPSPELYQKSNKNPYGLIFFGTSAYAALEADELLKAEGIHVDSMRIKALPFNEEVNQFIKEHDQVFVIDQNRDGQFRSLLINELDVNPQQLISILNYDGMPITADNIIKQVKNGLAVASS